MDGNTENIAVVITPGFPGAQPEALTRVQRLARRAALPPADAERALTHIIAYLSGLEVDETLFRRDFPAEIADAALVKLVGETADTSPDHRSFTILFAGRETTSGAILPKALKLLGGVPLRWLTVSGSAQPTPVTVAELELLKPAKFGDSFVGGREVAVFEAELRARICTTLPRGGATS